MASSSHLQTLLLLLFFTTFSQHFLRVAFAVCHVDDESGLLAFKSGITSDPSGMLSSWKPKTDCCTWAGINCRENNRVTTVSLTGEPGNKMRYLSGTISPQLSKVQNLDGIYFQDLQNITGTFPTFLYKLPKLKYVYINNMKLSGPIPVDIGDRLPKLEALSFEANRFTGPLPASISKMTELGQIRLRGNKLSGRIPDIRNLKSLTLLNLEQNQLTGTIPNFGSLTNLLFLNLKHNKLTGEIPASISSLAPKLVNLEVGHNLLTGKIPSFLGNFKSLDTLDLSSNRFTGIVPQTFKNLTKIFNLDLSRNNLTDPFPELNVKGIESLDLSYNHFKLGKIPQWVTSSPIIYSLKLAACGIKMRLQDWKPSETYFYDYIDLSHNQISGSPVELLNKTEFLIEFSASKNLLKFDMFGLKVPKTLKKLDLSRNQIFGKVPVSVVGVEKVNVSYNHLCGKLPVNKFPVTAVQGNDCLCGSPLAPCKS